MPQLLRYRGIAAADLRHQRVHRIAGGELQQQEQANDNHRQRRQAGGQPAQGETEQAQRDAQSVIQTSR